MHEKRGLVKMRTSNGATTEFTYDLIDQLRTETRNGYEAEYTYDACGRLIEVVAPNQQITQLQWDYEDRLISITYPNSSTNSFGYNGFGARISKSDSTGNYTFLRNGTGVTAPVLSDSYAEYTPGISEKRSTNSTFYHSDIKNTTAQTNSDQNITGTNTYDAFGNLIDYDGTWNGPFSYGGKFGYQTDNDSGLMLLGHRYYDSSTGRFLSRDPIGDGSNWYSYCINNPLKFADRNGLSPEPTFERVVDPWLDDGPATSFSTGRLPSFPWWKFEFDLEVVTNGLKTGAAGIGSAFSLGFWDGGSYKDEPGFGFAKGAATVAMVALAGAGGLAVVPRATLVAAGENAIPALRGTVSVIGNKVTRVAEVAEKYGYAYFTVATKSKVIGWFQNLKWIVVAVFTRNVILDIGPIPGGKPYGAWYWMERIVTRLLCK
jgi:RHS repeat-associated protein